MVPRSRPRGFTLVELLVVVAIIALLIAMLFPAIQLAREAARRSSCMSKMRQIGLALINVHDTQKNFPPSCHVKRDPYNHRIADMRGWSWVVDILPYLEQVQLYDTLDVTRGSPMIRYGTPDAHLAARMTSLPELLCPSTNSGKFAATDIWPEEALASYKVMGATHFESLNVASLDPTVPLYPKSHVLDVNPNTDFRPSRQHPDGACFPGSRLNLNNNFKDGTTHTIYLTETIENVYARWPLGWEMALVGLPTVGEDAVSFDNSYNERFYHPWAYNGYTGDESTVPSRFRTFLNHDYNILWYIPVPVTARNDIFGYKFIGQQYGPSSQHGTVVNHLFADGSVHSIKRTIDVALYMFLITRDNGDPVPERDEVE